MSKRDRRARQEQTVSLRPTAGTPQPAPAARLDTWVRSRSAVLVLLSVALALYLNTLFNDFVIDDRLQIVENQFVHRVSGLRQIFTTHVWAFTGEKALSVYYRPLMYACWVAIWQVSGAHPAGYHILNILLHTGVTLLVLLWLLRVGANAATAWVAALLFAVHPVHTEAVAWISALPDLECAFFFLLGFWLYVGCEESIGWRRYALLAGVGMCALLALLAKEIGVALPLMLVLYDLDKKHRQTSQRVDVSPGDADNAAASSRRGQKLFGYAALALAVMAYFLLRRHALGAANVTSALPEGAGTRLIAGWLGLLSWYARLLVLPVRLSAFHMVPLPTGFLHFQTFAGLAVAGCLLGLAVWLHRLRRPEWLAVALLLLSLLPSFLAPLRGGGFWIGERYLYLPSAGFCWLLGAALAYVLGRRRRVLVALVAALALLFAARTVFRNADWRQEIPFYLHELRTEQESWKLRSHLADAMLRNGMAEQALEHARAWAQLTPDDQRAHSALSEIYWTLENPEQALPESRRAAMLAYEQGDAAFAAQEFVTLAVRLSQTGQPESSLDAYREAIRLSPDSADIRHKFGIALFTAGKFEEAAVHFRAAALLSPQSAWCRAYLGVALARMRDYAGARAALAEAARRQPNSAEILAWAGEVEQAAGDREAARQWFQRALVVDPANLRARAGLSSLR